MPDTTVTKSTPKAVFVKKALILGGAAIGLIAVGVLLSRVDAARDAAIAAGETVADAAKAVADK